MTTITPIIDVDSCRGKSLNSQVDSARVSSTGTPIHQQQHKGNKYSHNPYAPSPSSPSNLRIESNAASAIHLSMSPSPVGYNINEEHHNLPQKEYNINVTPNISDSHHFGYAYGMRMGVHDSRLCSPMDNSLRAYAGSHHHQHQVPFQEPYWSSLPVNPADTAINQTHQDDIAFTNSEGNIRPSLSQHHQIHDSGGTFDYINSDLGANIRGVYHDYTHKCYPPSNLPQHAKSINSNSSYSKPFVVRPTSIRETSLPKVQSGVRATQSATFDSNINAYDSDNIHSEFSHPVVSGLRQRHQLPIRSNNSMLLGNYSHSYAQHSDVCSADDQRKMNYNSVLNQYAARPNANFQSMPDFISARGSANHSEVKTIPTQRCIVNGRTVVQSRNVTSNIPNFAGKPASAVQNDWIPDYTSFESMPNTQPSKSLVPPQAYDGISFFQGSHGNLLYPLSPPSISSNWYGSGGIYGDRSNTLPNLSIHATRGQITPIIRTPCKDEENHIYNRQSVAVFNRSFNSRHHLNVPQTVGKQLMTDDSQVVADTFSCQVTPKTPSRWKEKPHSHRPHLQKYDTPNHLRDYIPTPSSKRPMGSAFSEGSGGRETRQKPVLRLFHDDTEHVSSGKSQIVRTVVPAGYPDLCSVSTTKPTMGTDKSMCESLKKKKGEETFHKVVLNSTQIQRRIAQRKKQVQLGKGTRGYVNYLAHVPVCHREVNNPNHPVTPLTETTTSKRTFDKVLCMWRKALHAWDRDSDEYN
eukprot:Tbor_TRINITY_DN5205_c0_g1::TRINITY_DN5205_c0_g1_i1::g.16715::m.16715